MKEFTIVTVRSFGTAECSEAQGPHPPVQAQVVHYVALACV